MARLTALISASLKKNQREKEQINNTTNHFDEFSPLLPIG